MTPDTSPSHQETRKMKNNKRSAFVTLRRFRDLTSILNSSSPERNGANSPFGSSIGTVQLSGCMAGAELAKEVSGPLASVIALGGFTAWWLISSKKEEPDDLGKQITKHVLSGLSIIDNIQAQVTNLLTGNSESTGFTQTHESKDQECSSSPSNSEVIQCSSGSTIGSSGFDVTSSQTSLEEAIPETDSRIHENKLLEDSTDKFDCFQECPERFEMDKLVEAVMQGDAPYLFSALDALGSAPPDEYGCDEFGNTLLILAVQVLAPFSPAQPACESQCSHAPQAAQTPMVLELIRRGADLDAQNWRAPPPSGWPTPFLFVRAASNAASFKRFASSAPE